MPKKTKREKILAELHRRQAPITPSLPVVTTAYQWQRAQFPLRPAATVALSNDQEYHAIKQDLVKTIILAAGAIGIELLLYIKIGK